MRLAPSDAQRFIQGYKQLMLEVAGVDASRVTESLVPLLAKGRARLASNPTLFQKAVAKLEARRVSLDPGVAQAIEGLEVQSWVYLRDTRYYSILIDPKATRGFGVLGLTQGLRDIVGGTGLVMEVGVVRYAGHYVCDGVMAQSAWLGPNFRKSFTEKLKEIKEAGRFYVKADA